MIDTIQNEKWSDFTIINKIITIDVNEWYKNHQLSEIIISINSKWSEATPIKIVYFHSRYKCGLLTKFIVIK